MTAQPRPEVDLIVHCGRPSIDTETATRVEELAEAGLDWEDLVRMARNHRMVPLLYRRLNSICAAAVPDDRLFDLRERTRHITRRNLHLTDELFALLDRLDEHGIPTIPYKGPTLAAQAYGSVSLRDFFDLDVLVPRTDVPTAVDVVRSQGYRSSSRLSADQEAARMRYSHEHRLYRKYDETNVELHWQPLGDDFHTPTDIKTLSTRLERIDIAGRTIETLPAERLLVILCAHGAKHGWGRLAWTCDVAALVENTTINWPQVIGYARQMRSERLLFVGVCLARDLFDITLPERVNARIGRDRSVRSLATEVRETLLQTPYHWPNFYERSWLYIRARERHRDGLRCALSMALTPEEQDVEWCSLPPSLSSLYYLLRPMRLLTKSVR